MPIISFSKLLDKLLDGTKTQTIRKPRKQPLKVGDKLYVYWMLRTKQCRKLGEARITKIERKQLWDMTEEDARKDGFTRLIDLDLEILKMHDGIHMSDNFDVITFEWTFKFDTFAFNIDTGASNY